MLHANLIQKLWAEHLVDGADAGARQADPVARASPNTQRLHEDMHAMADSQTTAQVVAERALGEHVPIDELGARWWPLEPGYPAAKAGLEPGDIVTAVNGTPVNTAGDLIRPDGAGRSPAQRCT